MNNFERFIIGDCTIIRHTNFTFRAVFGRDKDNTVSTTVSIYGTRSCIFKDKTVPEVLDELFAKENIHYVINDKHIALYKGNERQVALQAKKDIKGVVTDKNGEPIPGANIIEKGNPTNGTITDVDGNYTLSVFGNSVLVASYIGYNRIEIQVKDRSVVDITLSEDTQALEEVVVVGYSTQKKVNLTGSVSTQPQLLNDVGRGLLV